MVKRLLTVALVVAAQVAIRAQEAKDQFVPQAQLPQQAELPAAPLVYGAYAFVWAVLIVYVFVVWRRVAKVERELADVNMKLKGR